MPLVTFTKEPLNANYKRFFSKVYSDLPFLSNLDSFLIFLISLNL